jgi:hypothetical protein
MSASLPDADLLARLRRARIATIAFFAINGMVGFSILPRLVEIQQRADLDDAGLGIALAVGTAGAAWAWSSGIITIPG